jgi:heme-degrading monooxygenase HmoA
MPPWPSQAEAEEKDMFARRVTLNLKPNSAAEFTQRLEKEVIPMLRKQKGFQDEITFVVPAGTEAFGVSLWDNKESADAYSRGSYAEVTKMLEKLVDGTPRVETYEVSNSTFHKIGAAVAA